MKSRIDPDKPPTPVLQPTRITKKNKALARYPRCASLADEIALIPGGFKEFARFLKMVPMWYPKLEGPVVTFFKEVPPSQQNGVTLEEMCMQFGERPSELLGKVVEIAFEQKRNVAKMIQSVFMPDVIQENAKQARKPKGIKDRELFMESTGLIQRGRGSITVNANAQAANLTNSGEASGLPDFEDSTNSFSEVIRNATEQNVAPSEPVPDAEIVEEE